MCLFSKSINKTGHRVAEKAGKQVGKEQERSTHKQQTALFPDPEEVVVPSIGALLGILLNGFLYFVLPSNLILGPNWLLLVVGAVFVLPLLIDLFTPWDFSHTTRHVLILAPLGLSTLALILGVALFILTLPSERQATNLLRAAVVLWCFNILVFALWYWELDGGGPMQRHRSGYQAADFLFPQQANGQQWKAQFFDYLFVAFTTATAFSPADTVPLTPTTKGLMMLEAVVSFMVIAFLAARAVNIL